MSKLTLGGVIKIFAAYVVSMSIVLFILQALVAFVHGVVAFFSNFLPFSAAASLGNNFATTYVTLRVLSLLILALLFYAMVHAAPKALKGVGNLFSKFVGSPLKSGGIDKIGGHNLSSPFESKFWGLNKKDMASKALRKAVRSGRNRLPDSAKEIGDLMKGDSKKNTGKRSAADARTAKQKKIDQARKAELKKKDKSAKGRSAFAESNKAEKVSNEKSDRMKRWAQIGLTAAAFRIDPKSAKALTSAMGIHTMMNNANRNASNNSMAMANMEQADAMRKKMFGKGVYDNIDEEKEAALARMGLDGNRDVVGDIHDEELDAEGKRLEDKDKKTAANTGGKEKSETGMPGRGAAAAYSQSAFDDGSGLPETNDEHDDVKDSGEALNRGRVKGTLSQDIVDKLNRGEELTEEEMRQLEDESIDLGKRGVSLTGETEFGDERSFSYTGKESGMFEADGILFNSHRDAEVHLKEAYGDDWVNHDINQTDQFVDSSSITSRDMWKADGQMFQTKEEAEAHLADLEQKGYTPVSGLEHVEGYAVGDRFFTDIESARDRHNAIQTQFGTHDEMLQLAGDANAQREQLETRMQTAADEANTAKYSYDVNGEIFDTQEEALAAANGKESAIIPLRTNIDRESSLDDYQQSYMVNGELFNSQEEAYNRSVELEQNGADMNATSVNPVYTNSSGEIIDESLLMENYGVNQVMVGKNGTTIDESYTADDYAHQYYGKSLSQAMNDGDIVEGEFSNGYRGSNGEVYNNLNDAIADSSAMQQQTFDPSTIPSIDDLANAMRNAGVASNTIAGVDANNLIDPNQLQNAMREPNRQETLRDSITASINVQEMKIDSMNYSGGLGNNSLSDHIHERNSFTDQFADNMINVDSQSYNQVADLVANNLGHISPTMLTGQMQNLADSGNPMAAQFVEYINNSQQRPDAYVSAQSFAEATRGIIPEDMNPLEAQRMEEALVNSVRPNGEISYTALEASLMNVDSGSREEILNRFQQISSEPIPNNTMISGLNEVMSQSNFTPGDIQKYQSIISDNVYDGQFDYRSAQERLGEMYSNGDANAGKLYDYFQDQRANDFIPRDVNFSETNLTNAISQAMSSAKGGNEMDVDSLASALGKYGVKGFDAEDLRQAMNTGQGSLADEIKQAVAASTLTNSLANATRPEALQMSPQFMTPPGAGVIINNNYTTVRENSSPFGGMDINNFKDALTAMIASSAISKMTADSPANTARFSQETLHEMQSLHNTIRQQALTNPGFNPHDWNTMPPESREVAYKVMNNLSDDYKMTTSNMTVGTRAESDSSVTSAEFRQVEEGVRAAIVRTAEKALKEATIDKSPVRAKAELRASDLNSAMR